MNEPQLLSGLNNLLLSEASELAEFELLQKFHT